MDDVNNMDESMDRDEQEAGGISRRDMIRASVVAGALVWSAPVLLTGKASANHVWPPDPADENCPCMGTLIRLNLSASGTINCGSIACLDNRDPSLVNEVPCGEREDDIICAIEADNLITFGAGTNFMTGVATVNLDPQLTVVAVSVLQQGGGNPLSRCFFTDCGPTRLSTTPGALPANTNISGAALPLPNRVWVTNGGQTINVDTTGTAPIIELGVLLCVSQAVTGMC